jgi:hypothetical protein
MDAGVGEGDVGEGDVGVGDVGVGVVGVGVVGVGVTVIDTVAGALFADEKVSCARYWNESGPQ